jgi:hypothetical protein
MTVSEVAFSPRQWPPQPVESEHSLHLESKQDNLTFQLAVAVGVVASEQDTGLVSIGNLVKPTNWLGGRGIAKVLLVDL